MIKLEKSFQRIKKKRLSFEIHEIQIHFSVKLILRELACLCFENALKTNNLEMFSLRYQDRQIGIWMDEIIQKKALEYILTGAHFP